MQKYHPKTALASVFDHLFRGVFACIVGIGWFAWLWGLRMTTITAGIGLGGLFWLLLRQLGKHMTQKRESQMRRLIGGELALRRLLLCNAKQAGFQAALWIVPLYPFVMQKTIDWGVLGMLNNQKAIIRVIAQHESVEITVQQIIDVIREMHTLKPDRYILCLTAPATPQAIHYAAEYTKPIDIVTRSEMIDLAGRCSPATDEQLSQLRKRKPQLNRRQLWAKAIDPSRAKRYFCYGIGLSGMAVLTGQKVYPIPAIICLGLFVLCKLQPSILTRAGIGQRNPFQNR